MISSYLFKVFLVYTLLCICTPSHKPKDGASICSRDQSSLVRQILHKIWKPIFHEYGMKLPKECPLHFSRDVYKFQELAKLHYRVNLWTCGFCGKSFYKEGHLDTHIAHRHFHHVFTGDETVCLADYCDVFRCKGFELEGDSSSLFNETLDKPPPSGKNNQNKALVLGPPHELAVLINAGEREINSEAFIGLSGILDPILKKRKPEFSKKDDLKENNKDSLSHRERDLTKKRRSSIIENLDHRAPTNEDSYNNQDWLFHPDIEEKCDNQAMEAVHTKCQNLIHDCVSPLLHRLSSEEYKSISQYLDRRICWYLTCDRYWQFLGSKRPGSSFVLLLVLGSSLILFLAMSYYIVWFCF